jgi:RNA polymerase sigma-70 factor (ECF subfamily)
MIHSDTISSAPRSQEQSLSAADAGLALLRRFSDYHDAQAFAQIVQRYASFVYATCLRITADPARSEDLSQETFFRLMRRPHEVHQNLGGWLHRTATHLALDSLRSESARKRREIAYTRPCQRDASTWAELSPCVDQAISELPEELRALMVRHFLLGHTQAQLAEETGLSPATISRRMHQGLEELRRRLRLKGIYALPAVLAGLLCHVAARQAPAALVRELGKMTLFGSAAGGGFKSGCSAGTAARALAAPRTVLAKIVAPQLLVALAGLVGALILLQAVDSARALPWERWLAPPAQHDEPGMRPGRASAQIVGGIDLSWPLHWRSVGDASN